MKIKTLLYIFGILLSQVTTLAQEQKPTRKDTLQGGLRPERTNYDVLKYHLNLKVIPEKKYIEGFNEITFKTIRPLQKMQIDLFDNMTIDSIVFKNKKMNYQREFHAVFIDFSAENNLENTTQNITIYYKGNPIEAKNAPWDGGFVYKKDAQGKPWIGVAVQGKGASIWYPCKDSQTDEPDYGALVEIAVPNGLMNVSNGKLIRTTPQKDNYTLWSWEVKNPINNYDITLNIADYAHFEDVYKNLSLDYYVLKENLEKAKIQFEEVKPMLDCFQSKFGPYPFENDGYKLVETPYLGMEHQSAVAYGNKYRKGYLGMDLSGTGVGLKFDFIIIHESGHEWFGNSITSADIADMWIHEGFTQYAEIVYVECTQGYDAALKYAKGLQKNVKNDVPIIGIYGVNREGSGDMYPKGAMLLQTLRHCIDNDELWWKLLYDYSTTFKHKIIDTKTVIDYFNQYIQRDYTAIFNQYLRYTTIPKLEISKQKKFLEYRWVTTEPNFSMPIVLEIDGKEYKIKATNSWQKLDLKSKKAKQIKVDISKYYINLDVN
ncbi:peptidase M1-like protein [Flavobacterium croceum DSM 17960]|uniref:Peptidase M1-like protein n=1 Tax=Flavobacterium croceum DSM 17960 TaxID=1121886 RepID=A0A2S4N993_9FLAO|nr:M1 family metallopeptidase [Flavobacterium croceum]POS02023.1 peptidase M1-like protein [Flavobacterium croceum DSM 17960]